MKFFEVSVPIDNKYGYIKGLRTWRLPGIRCDGCDETWATTGVSYPSVDLSDLPDRPLFEKTKVVFPETYFQLEGQLMARYPELRLLTPGTSFGPLQAKSVGKRFSDFVPFEPWNLLITNQAYGRLRAETSLNLPRVTRVVLESAIDGLEILEFELIPCGKLLNAVKSDDQDQECLVCGRTNMGRLPEYLVVDRASFPVDLDVFRLENFSTVIIGTEDFKDAVVELGLTGLTWREVVVS